MKPMVDFWINQLISEHVFFLNRAVHIGETNPLIGRKNCLMQLGDFEKSSHHPKPMMTL